MIDRRAFLKQAGLSSLALGALPALVDAFAQPAVAQSQRAFVFLAISAVNYRELGTYGGSAAGVGQFVVDIQRLRPSPAVFRGAVLTVYCNLCPAGLQTGEVEDYTLSIPDTDFAAGGTPGPFRQIPPMGVGLTVFQLPEAFV